ATSRPRALRARSAVTAFQPQLAGDCGVWHGKRILAQHLPTIIRHLMNHKSYEGMMAHTFREADFLVPPNSLITLNEIANKGVSANTRSQIY
ncbi:hypothetical protein, partial [Lacticaseibacillus paracasei]|uniref:hypothetical protein n=1 Tax=Lacticaseibacillus paracasei TaxID=1597 RepID=UPI0021A94ED9